MHAPPVGRWPGGEDPVLRKSSWTILNGVQKSRAGAAGNWAFGETDATRYPSARGRRVL